MTAQTQHNSNRDSAPSVPAASAKTEAGVATPSSKVLGSAVLESHVLRALRKTLAVSDAAEASTQEEPSSAQSTPLKTSRDGNDKSRNGKNAPSAPAQAPTQDAYTILGITADADQKDIHAAFRRLALHWHPDRHEEQYQRAAERRFQAIAHAYERIKTREKRALYDRVLADLQSLAILKQAAAQAATHGKRVKNTASAATKTARHSTEAVAARNAAGFATRLGGVSNDNKGDNKGRLQAINLHALKHQAVPQNRDTQGLRHRAGAALDVLETIFWPLRSEKAESPASPTDFGADFGPL